MKKYLIFRNNPASGKSNSPGSPEDIACDIIRAIEMAGVPQKAFIAYLADSPEAMFATIQSTPLLSIELDQAKIDTGEMSWQSYMKKWHNMDIEYSALPSLN